MAPDNQLFAYVAATLQGDLGYSMKYQGQSVVQVIEDRFWPTILLIGLAEVIAIFVGPDPGGLHRLAQGRRHRPGRQWASA